MRTCLIALSSILESVVTEARLEVRAIAPLEAGEIEAATETISATRIWKTRRVQVQSEIREWTIGYATISTCTVASEPSIAIENEKLVNGKGTIVDLLDVGELVPVGLCAGIATLLLQENFVGSHEESVPGEESPHTVLRSKLARFFAMNSTQVFSPSAQKSTQDVKTTSITWNICTYNYVGLDNVRVMNLIPTILGASDCVARV